MEINKEHFEKAMALQKAFDQGAQSQQQKIDELQKRIDDALKVLNDASPTMLDKKAIKILKGESHES